MACKMYFETAGMRLSTGEIIYTDPLNADTDGNGLKDGEEIIPQFKFVDSSSIGLPWGSCGIYFNMVSDPTMGDSDEDGISDIEDTAPFSKGIYGGFVGELTIVSAAQLDSSGVSLGHSFLVYKSYVNDELDFSNFHSGYGNNSEGYFVHYTKTDKYNIKRNKYVTIGLYSDDDGGTVCGNSIPDLFNTTFGNSSKTNGGISYNWELYNYYREKSDNQKPNAALTKSITQKQLNQLIKFAELNNYYSLLNHNCTIVALWTWDLLFGVDFYMTMFPYDLKNQISSKKNSFELDMEELLINM